MTINELASAIRNNVVDGLSGNISDQAFSIEQLYDEIDLARANFIHQYAGTKKLDYKFLVQSLDSIPVECRNLSNDCQIADPTAEVPSIKIPRLASIFGEQSIEYLGLNNMTKQIPIYYTPDQIRFHHVKLRTKHLPYSWVDLAPDRDGNQTIYFFNMNSHDPLKYVKLRGVFEHPMKLLREAGVDSSNLDYPAPGHMQESIKDKLTQYYLEIFRKLNVIETPDQNVDNIS
jgi:hypothetical protein